jgi:2-polyprenyl-6-methoxyphenol hydroxylase-like FAD-dependent oxidoreductase
MAGDPDVIVVGASVAGCTAAALFARAGARVLLLEKHSRIETYKVLCTHTLQPCAVPVIDRLRLRPQLEAAGARPHVSNYWTPLSGWIAPKAAPGEALPHGFNLRRKVLDPMLRELAASTSGVELRLGQSVVALIEEDGRIVGVRTRASNGQETSLRARLVVGADGRDSTVAELAGATRKDAPNHRFAYFGYFQDLQSGEHPPTQIWFLDPDGAYCMPNEDGISVLIVAPKKTPEHLAAFRDDGEAAFRQFVRDLPDAPPIDDVPMVGKLIGMQDFSLRSRTANAPGLALIGDATLSTDPMWGIGCAWGMLSASWLVDEVGPAALGEGGVGDLDRGLASYTARHQAEIGGYQRLFESFATARPLNPLERLMFGAAARDEASARHLYLFGSRLISVPDYIAPPAIARAVLAQDELDVDTVLADLRAIPHLDVDEISRLVAAGPPLVDVTGLAGYAASA